jgi:UDP-hydrolysing UDP-N-acetyl-D-glucosamine 2-epimerase
MKTKIAVYTSTRAEYGLMRPLLKRLEQKQEFETRLFVTGTHFSEKYGYTVSEIEKDFPNLIHYRVEHNITEDVKHKSTIIMSDAIASYAKALVANPPDLAVVLGDRYEALCFGLVCASLNIPLVHLHGGELTYGAIDDKYRHCLTKLSEWHFVACETYRNRVMQLGENPKNIYNVGSLGVDNALNLKLLNRDELQTALGVELSGEYYVFTFHPETNSPDFGVSLLNAFLNKIETHLKNSITQIILTGVNNDPGSALVKKVLEDFCQRNKSNVFYFESLGVLKYLSAVSHATAVLGNSSSGVLEAHSLKTPAINVGSRQEGRERETSLIDFPTEDSLHSLNFSKLIELKHSLSTSKNSSNFGDGKASAKMVEALSDIAQNLVANSKPIKRFFDKN